MKSFRFWSLSALTLLAVSWLHADTLPVDPTIVFKTIGGHGSIDITCVTQGCESTSANPADLVQANGFANLSVANMTGQTITSLVFYIPTTNFDQTFTASTPDFQNAVVSTGTIFGVDTFEIPGVCSILTGGVIKTSCITVTYFSGSPVTGNPFTLPPDAEDVAEGPGTPGFVPGTQIVVQAFFGGPLNGFPGFKNGDDGTLTLAADTPEPATMGLMLSGLVGIVFLARRRRQTA